MLKKNCGEIIPHTGEEAKSVNCYTIYLSNINGEVEYQVKGVDKRNRQIKVNALDPKSNTFSIPKKITLNQILNKHMDVTYHYKGWFSTYDSIYVLLFNIITKYDKTKINIILLSNKIAQFLYNRKPLKSSVRIDRIHLLKFLYDEQVNKYDPLSSMRTSSVNHGMQLYELIPKLYKPRWIHNPRSEKERQKLNMHLQSLVESGELKLDVKKTGYIVTTQALKTIEKYDEDERRHKDNIRIQWILASIFLIQALEALPKKISDLFSHYFSLFIDFLKYLF